jgi:hypothetical protein
MDKLAKKRNANDCFCDLWGLMMESMCDFADYHPEGCEPIFAAFNVASKHRGGHQLGMGRFEKEEKQ